MQNTQSENPGPPGRQEPVQDQDGREVQSLAADDQKNGTSPEASSVDRTGIYSPEQSELSNGNAGLTPPIGPGAKSSGDQNLPQSKSESASAPSVSPFERPTRTFDNQTGPTTDAAASNPVTSPVSSESPVWPSSTQPAKPLEPAGPSSSVPSPYPRTPQEQRLAAQATPPQSFTPPATEKSVAESAPKKPVEHESVGLLDLFGSEELVSEVDSGDEGKFVLTSKRLIYQGRSADGPVFASASVEDVKAIEFGRRPRDSRSAWWGVVGLIAAVAVWQVTTNETVGAFAGAIVGGISLLLLADYWFRPSGLILRFGTAGGTVEGPISGKHMRDAEQLAAKVQQLQRPGSSTSGRGSTRPPGGSPGLN